MEYKKLIPCIRIKGDQVYLENKPMEISLKELGEVFNNHGADAIAVLIEAKTDKEKEDAVHALKETVRAVDIPVYAGGSLFRLEDVKKYLYAGARQVIFPDTREGLDLMKAGADRFGKDKMMVSSCSLEDSFSFASMGAGSIWFTGSIVTSEAEVKACPLPVYAQAAVEEPELIKRALSIATVHGVMMPVDVKESEMFMDLKQLLKAYGIRTNTFEPSIAWKDFKKNESGLVPVIVQDYKTDEVLMLAYMNEEAFDRTIQSGKMTYFSRSRQSLWVKGETSGHFQYVKSMLLDCDNDTLLAKVAQVGAACHTGSYSCFFKTLIKKEYDRTNPLKVFEEVYSVIADRKEHPKNGSYTNYLFDKGIDKILKKVGEEATEIVIAAKNPDPEEIKYEISDFLYHAMVLMVERGITWEDITQELANR